MCISDLLGLFNCLRTYPESAREQITTPRNGPLREETPQAQLRMVLLQKSPVNPIFIKNPETLWYGQKIVAAYCRLFQSLGMSRSKPGVLYPPCVFSSPFEGSISEMGIFRQLTTLCRFKNGNVLLYDEPSEKQNPINLPVSIMILNAWHT